MKTSSAKIGLRPACFLFLLLTVSYLQIFSSIVLAATSFNVTNLTANNPVTAGYTGFRNIQLNDVGQAAFVGENPTLGDPQGHPRADVFFWDGTILKNITADIPGFVVFSGPNLFNLNQNGQIVFIAATDFNFFRPIPFFYNGTSVQNLAASLPASSGANVFLEIVINDTGKVAFSGCQSVGSVGACIQPSLFLFNGSVVNLVVNDFVDQITSLSINASGHVAWGAQQFEDIGFFDGTSIRVITDDAVAKGSGYFQFFFPKLNNADQIIFGASKTGRTDVFFFNGNILKNLTENDPTAGGQGFNFYGIFSQLELNENGQTAFYGGKLPAPPSDVFFFDGSVLKNITKDDPATGGSGFNAYIDLPHINQTGQLSFIGAKLFDSTEVFFFGGQSITNLTADPSVTAGPLSALNSTGHVAFLGKDSSTTTQRVLDIFFFDGSAATNATAGQAAVNGIFFPNETPSLLKFNNIDQILAVGRRTDNTSDVVLLSPTATPPPSPVLAVTPTPPTPLDFQTITVGTSKDLPFTVQNTGGGTLTGSASTSAPFSIFGDNSFSLATNQSKSFTVRFSPTSTTTFNGNVSVASNAGPASVVLVGTGESPPFRLGFPLASLTAYTAPISSVFDHSVPNGFYGARSTVPDKKVVAFTGATGESCSERNTDPCRSSFHNQFSYGYANILQTPFVLDGANYTGGIYLFYDGHPGYDYAVPLGTKIYAAADGVLTVPTTDPVNGNPTKFNTITIDHENGFSTWYLHSSKLRKPDALGNQESDYVSSLPPGTSYSVKRGDPIAEVGCSGLAGCNKQGKGSHLHFDMRKNSIPIDPYGWEGQLPDPYTRALNIKLWE